MRVLLLFRGSPGCGKSTFIEKNGLKPYTLSADDIRLLYSGPIILKDGTKGINQEVNHDTWNTLFNILEYRMQNGDFTVIDATNSKTIEMNRYKEFAAKYRYRIFCIDMTDIPIEIVKERNNQREEVKRVPEDVIDLMYARFKSQKIPSGITIIKPEELEKIWYKKPIDLSNYDKIHVIGDIHGCNTVLQNYFKDNEYKNDEFYIFTGDYLDRGIENSEVLNFLIDLSKNNNVMFLEGNHERHLRDYSNNKISNSSEFEENTKPQINSIPLKKIRQFCYKLSQCIYLKYYDKEFLITHGGLSNFPKNLTLVSTKQMIKGVGGYEDALIVDNNFTLNSPNNVYQIHGHRNPMKIQIKSSQKTFNLEGSVEFGGDLRCVQITKEKIDEIYVKNNIYKKQEGVAVVNDIKTADLLFNMRNSKYIREKQFDNISSFNFSSKAFEKKIWNNLTIKARGLFIDTQNCEIVARSYDKFFNINERSETELFALEKQFKFPVTAYLKENGFLAIISWDKEKNDLLIASKSSLNGIHVDYIKNLLYNVYSNDTIKRLKEYLKNNNVSFVFECCDHINDVHVIEYKQDELILLDIIHNKSNFEKETFDKLVEISNKIGLKHKEKAYILNNWQEFYNWYNEIIKKDYTFTNNNIPIEGFVIEDSNNYMVKVKTYYYNLWKKLRQVFDNILKYGYYRNTGSLQTVLENEFYQWSLEFYNSKTKSEIKEFKSSKQNNICYLRNEFYKFNDKKK